jgi:hypothetical protein
MSIVAIGLALCVSLPAAAADTKWVRGTVTAVSADTITVKVMNKDMTFKVDPQTEIVGPGLGTKTREAQAAGQKGVPLPQMFKSGDRMEVHYTSEGAVMKAVEIRTGTSAPDAASEPQAKQEGTSARGAVTAVGPDSITVKGDAGQWTFAVDSKTQVVGSGLGTLSREKAKEGKGTTLTDLLKVGDKVVVNFEDRAGKSVATYVRVTGRSS